MKKMMTIMLLALVCVFTACADDVKTNDVSKLPPKAQSILKNFAADILVIEIDNEIFGNKYEVKLTDGTEIDFDKNGEWNSIDCKSTSVPKQFIPQKIEKYVTTNYKTAIISKIEKSPKGYDIELSNELDLKFNLQGDFLRIDD